MKILLLKMLEKIKTEILEDSQRGGVVTRTTLSSGLRIITESIPTV